MRTAVIVMGVSGSGKTTVADLLSERMGWPVAEADDFHSEANKAKMSAGTPLDDDDRAPWLAEIRDWISAQPSDVIVTCSALKRVYRDVLRGSDHRVRFLHLDGSKTVIGSRMSGRSGHFMPTTLLTSQLETLEPLDEDEDGVVVEIGDPADEVVAAALAALGLTGVGTGAVGG